LTYAACSSRVEPTHLGNHLGGGSLGLLGLLGAVGGLGLGALEVIIRLVRAVDGNLDSDLTALDLLAVHLSHGLLLQLLRGQGNETEAAALASLAASLELLDHEAGDGAEGDLGRQRLVRVEQLLELSGGSVTAILQRTSVGVGGSTNLLLGQVIREVSNHDLGLRGDTVGRGTALATLAGTSLSLGTLALLLAGRLVGDVLQSLGLDSSLLSGSGALVLLLLILLSVSAMHPIPCVAGMAVARTYTAVTAAAGTPATATASPTATAGGVAAASALGTALDVGTLGLLVRLGLASELDRDLALEDLLARELGDSTVGLGGGREVDKGVTDRAVGARVLRDGNRLTVWVEDAWLVSAKGESQDNGK